MGRLVKAFASNLGVCSAAQAELNGIIHGLNLAWNLGLSKILVEVDSKVVFQWLSKTGNTTGPLQGMIKECQKIIHKKEWSVKVEHIYREANRCADWLANFGISCNSNLVYFETPLRVLWP